MQLLPIYKKHGNIVMRIFRWDLQLHFFWGFFLTLLGVVWFPLYSSGIIITIIKELLDLWSKGDWSWGDFFCGVTGSIMGFAFIMFV